MSALRRAFPFLVAAATGVASGIYIFKPIVLGEIKQPADGSNVFNTPSSTVIPNNQGQGKDNDPSQ
ncbi:hypothetical protein HYPSUDRAFT_34044 [Hypholoma sublateritium FD-334 SS-4]|uniref:Uncharacterized protein n=1 Tax=Hypholoma sublateritium (strain FD-334 SS-4) TaxID=945553 RepID=A0A0D2PCM3_HYPSF|nr:hypothetical protein HYPSUDRAFT_34044 [Hypholoma sublateritium FD-334 SS-4]